MVEIIIVAWSPLPGPYTRILDISSGGALNCPAPWVYAAAADVSAATGVVAAPGACVAPSGPGCHSVFVSPRGVFKYLRGTVLGVQFGAVCAFGPSTRSTALNGTCEGDHTRMLAAC